MRAETATEWSVRTWKERHERGLWSDEWARNGGNTIEVGTYCGVSAAETAKQHLNGIIYSVDSFAGDHARYPSAHKMYVLNRGQNMRLFIGTFQQMVAEVGWPHDVTTVVVDGGHLYDSCRADLITATENLHYGSILVHDYTCVCFQDTVKRACDEVMGQWELFAIFDTTAIFRK